MSAILNCNISFIGGGNMAQALIGGLIARGVPTTRITVSYPVEKVRALLAEKDLHVTDDNLAAIRDADIVLFAVKASSVGECFSAIKRFYSAGKLVISIVAGAEIATIAKLLETDRIVRVMPNTPALV